VNCFYVSLGKMNAGEVTKLLLRFTNHLRRKIEPIESTATLEHGFGHHAWPTANVQHAAQLLRQQLQDAIAAHVKVIIAAVEGGVKARPITLGRELVEVF